MRFLLALIVLAALAGCQRRPPTPFIYFMGTPWAQASFNGEDGIFLLDTGASMSVVDVELARRAGAQRTGGLEVVGTTGRVFVDTGWADEMSFAGRRHTDRVVSIQNMQEFRGPAGRRQAGLIGNDFFLEYNVVFDMDRGNVALRKEEGPLSSGMLPYRMILAGGVPMVEVYFGDEKEPRWAKLDTGSGYAEEAYLYLDVCEPVARTLLGPRMDSPPERTATVVSIAGTETLPVYDYSPVRIFGETIHDVRLVVHLHGRGAFEDPDNILITGGLLRRFSRLELDFPRRTVWSRP